MFAVQFRSPDDLLEDFGADSNVDHEETGYLRGKGTDYTYGAAAPSRDVERVYTTVVVNVISWNKAYALSPRLSFIHRETYMLKPLNDYIGRAVAKYGNRG